jgi:hypothetical protein
LKVNIDGSGCQETSDTDQDNSLPGAKADQGKPRPGLVMKGFCNALWEVTKLGTFGSIKYSEFGFLKVENGIARYEDAGLRHQFAKWMAGDDYALDPETNLMEATAKAWNALAELELLLRKQKETNGQEKGNG